MHGHGVTSFSTGETTPQILGSAHDHTLKYTEVPEHVQRKAAELVKGLDHRSEEEQLSELQGAQAGKKVVQGVLIALYNSLTRVWKQMRVGLHDLKGIFQTNRFPSHASPLRCRYSSFYTERTQRYGNLAALLQ